LVAVTLAGVGLSLGIADGFTSLIHWGGRGSGEGDLRSPRGVAVAANPGRYTDVLVADTGNNRIERFNIAGHHLDGCNEDFNHPTGLDVITFTESNGRRGEVIWVADNDNNRVLEINWAPGARHCDAFQSFDSRSAPPLNHPEDVAVDPLAAPYTKNPPRPTPFFYVADTGNGGIARFYSSGRRYCNCFLKTQYPPTGVAVAPADGKLWVTELGPNGTGALAEYSAAHEGNRLLRTWTSFQGDQGTVSLGTPGDVTVDRQGHIYVVDASKGVVLKLNAQGRILDTTNFAFRFPWGVAVDPYNNLYVSDINRDVIEKFRQP
jgi:DNA-binding beta-propeller fold protein YncE